MSENQIEMVPVFYAKNRVTDFTKPEFWMTRAAARDLVDARLGKWTKHAKGLMLTRKGSEMHKTAVSLKMGAKLIFSNAAGDVRAQAIVAEWRPTLVPRRPPVLEAA